MRSACAASTFAVLALCAVEAAAQTQADFFDDTLYDAVRPLQRLRGPGRERHAALRFAVGPAVELANMVVPVVK